MKPIPLPAGALEAGRLVYFHNHGDPGAGAYRTGWLIVSDGGSAFVFRTFISARRIELPRRAAGEIRPGPLADSLRMIAEKRAYTLFLFKDGPPAEQALAELEAYT